MKQFIIFSLIILFSNNLFSQEDTVKNNLDFKVYGIFRAHLAAFGDDSEIQDASPRAGFLFDYHFGKEKEFTVFFGGELAINIIDNQHNFEADPNSNQTNFISISLNERKSTFSTRLGYVGVDFKKYGVLTIGKLNSVYKDIAGVTDVMNVMSGQASYIYSPTGTDGGESGTGRAEGAFTYKNSYKKFDFGLQTQFKANSGKTFFDSHSASISFRFTDYLSIGTAYNTTYLGPKYEEIEKLEGLDGDPFYFTANFIFKKGPLFISGIYTQQKNGDFVNKLVLDPGFSDTNIQSIIYSGKGYELIGSYLFFNKQLKVLLGFNYKDPDTSSQYLNDDFRKRLYLISAQYHFLKFASVYSEYKYEDSVSANGIKAPNVFLVGLRIDFNKTWSSNINL